MKIEDVAELMELLEKYFPQQRFSDAERWTTLLQRQPGTLEQGREAVLEVASMKSFCDPPDVIAEIKRIRSKNLSDTPVYDVPDFDENDHYRPELRAMLGRIADGGRGLAQVWQTPKEIESGAADPAYEASVRARAAVHGVDPEFVRQRDASLRVSCSWCKAAIGEVCTVDGVSVLVPAHHCRLVAAGVAEEVPRLSREEQIAILEADIANGRL